MDPTDGDVLAMANWPPVDPNDLSDADPDQLDEHGDRLHLRARLDLQGVHGRRRARGRLVKPETTFDVPPEIQVADRTIGESHPVGTGR